jgi:hypothetical protein
MKRRSFFRLLWGAPSLAFFRYESFPAPPPSRKEPLHECVDRPELPCPACTKWTGDPLAIQPNLSVASKLRKFFLRRAS